MRKLTSRPSSKSRPASAPQPQPRLGRVLIVDDDDAIREMIRMVLSDEGYEVRAFSRGDEALRRMAERPPDLILLDSRMPIMGGKEFFEAYRRTPGPHAPVIAVTAGRQTASTGGPEADGYLFKPFELEDLLEVVQRYTSNNQHPA